jgi:signal transduction histidine kinase
VRRPKRLDWVLTGAAFAIGIAELGVAKDVRGPFVVNVVAVAAIALPLAWWRTWPLRATVCLFAVAMPVEWLTSAGDLPAIWFTLLALSFGLGAHEDGRGAIAGIGVLVAGIIVTTAIGGSLALGDVAFPALLVAAFCVAGRTARSRARLAGELHEAAARANERRAARAERAVVEERKRIAREMHDVVAHSMSVMVVQAGGARRILERDRLRARDAAELIAGTGREALVELQRLLGVLNLEPAAAPTLDGLDGLVERARAAGLPVALTVDGERRPAARWHRARGLPGGPGGHHQRDQVRGRGADRGSRLLWRGGRRAARLRPRSGGRRAGARGRRRPRARRHARARAHLRRRTAHRAARRRRLRGARPPSHRWTGRACMSAATLSRPWRRRHPI